MAKKLTQPFQSARKTNHMADMPPNEVSKSLKVLQIVWPIALAATIGGFTLVRTDAKVESTIERVDYLYKDGPPAVVERLGRMEERQTAAFNIIKRMETQLDDLDKRSRDRNLKGL